MLPRPVGVWVTPASQSEGALVALCDMTGFLRITSAFRPGPLAVVGSRRPAR